MVMYRLRVVLGFMVSAVIVASAWILGWKVLRGELERVQAPSDLIAGLRIGWYWGSAAMFPLGGIVLNVFMKYAKDRPATRCPAQLVAALYVLFGGWATYTTEDSHFLIFAVPGVLLAVASWGECGAAGQ
jgi:hypothetical protein